MHGNTISSLCMTPVAADFCVIFQAGRFLLMGTVHWTHAAACWRPCYWLREGNSVGKQHLRPCTAGYTIDRLSRLRKRKTWKSYELFAHKKTGRGMVKLFLSCSVSMYPLWDGSTPYKLYDFIVLEKLL